MGRGTAHSHAQSRLSGREGGGGDEGLSELYFLHAGQLWQKAFWLAPWLGSAVPSCLSPHVLGALHAHVLWGLGSAPSCSEHKVTYSPTPAISPHPPTSDRKGHIRAGAW